MTASNPIEYLLGGTNENQWRNVLAYELQNTTFAGKKVLGTEIHLPKDLELKKASRLDLVLEDKEGLLVIECKTSAIRDDEQLERYVSACEEKWPEQQISFLLIDLIAHKKNLPRRWSSKTWSDVLGPGNGSSIVEAWKGYIKNEATKSAKFYLATSASTLSLVESTKGRPVLFRDWAGFMYEEKPLNLHLEIQFAQGRKDLLTAHLLLGLTGAKAANTSVGFPWELLCKNSELILNTDHGTPAAKVKNLAEDPKNPDMNRARKLNVPPNLCYGYGQKQAEQAGWCGFGASFEIDLANYCGSELKKRISGFVKSMEKHAGQVDRYFQW